MMKNRKYILIFLFLLSAGLANSQQGKQVIDFNTNWKFFLGNDSNAIQAGYDDSKWRALDLPHDWSIEGVFAEKEPATTQGGALPAGIGWYRKSFTLPSYTKGKLVSINFDGVYRNSEVWINGHYLGKRPYGYVSFSYDLTPYLKANASKNTIAVKVDNSQQPNSRWYTGSGIYRKVQLYINNQFYIKPSSVVVTTPLVSANAAEINISFDHVNTATQFVEARIRTTVVGPDGKQLFSQTGNRARFTLDGHFSAQVKLARPKLWSVEQPFLYTAKIELLSVSGSVIDTYSTTFGIRSFYFDKDRGFFLNDRSMKIKGVCLHHDLGALGSAFNYRAAERQLQILKDMGCNAIRTAHNPPASEFLDLCDKMGFLVMVEAFDMWKKKKNKFDYYADFAEWHERDITDMVLRDRNHPCVFMWSIGNEIREQFDSTGITIAKQLVASIKRVDNTRPVTCALSEWNPEKNFIYQSGALDIVGLNYHHEVYKDFHKYYPGQIFLGAENMSAFATRGHYDMPSDSTYFWPAKSPQKIVEKGNPDYTVSAYDQVSAYWGSTHETSWKLIKKYDFLSGLFVWSGFDFLGEPIPYPWPARSSYYGIIDLAGFPKDVYYMYQSEWTNKPVLHIFPHWNWTAGKIIDVWAYYNNADEVELFLNGKSLGIQKKISDDLHVMWRVPFQAGILKAISRRNGKTVLVKEIRTAGKPAKIELVADNKNLIADGKDLSFVTVRILDDQGIPVPDADNLIEFSVKGAGIIKATDNGYQADTSSFSSHSRKLWKGMGLAIIQSTIKKGNITLTASSGGLKTAIISLKSTD